jgi:DNA polymerase
MPTLHPAYLLRQPAHKKLAWRDLQAIAEKIESLGLLEPATRAN